MATHCSTLAWKIPWTEEPGRLQSMGLLGVRHDWATSLSLFTLMHWRRNGTPLQCSCLEDSRDGGACWAAVYGVAQSRTRLRRLSSSSRLDLKWAFFERVVLTSNTQPKCLHWMSLHSVLARTWYSPQHSFTVSLFHSQSHSSHLRLSLGFWPLCTSSDPSAKGSWGAHM